MGTINSAFQIMSEALDADQSALNVVANNVANANTTGYTRRDSQLAGELAGSDQRCFLRRGSNGNGRDLAAGSGAGGAAGPAATAGLGIRHTACRRSIRCRLCSRPIQAHRARRPATSAATSPASSIHFHRWKRTRQTTRCASRCSRPHRRLPAISRMPRQA